MELNREADGRHLKTVEKLDNMKQPAAILVLPVLYTILPESSSICNTGTDTGRY
jgi:hypothetical protein